MQVKIVSIGLIHKEVCQMKQYIFRQHATNLGTIDNLNKIQ